MAGAILVGKTNLHELSFGWTSSKPSLAVSFSWICSRRPNPRRYIAHLRIDDRPDDHPRAEHQHDGDQHEPGQIADRT